MKSWSTAHSIPSFMEKALIPDQYIEVKIVRSKRVLVKAYQKDKKLHLQEVSHNMSIIEKTFSK